MLLKPKTVNALADAKAPSGGKPPTVQPKAQTAKAAPAGKAAAADAKPVPETKDEAKPATPPPVMREAARALYGGISDAIVDIRCSANEQQEADLARNGYVQLLQDGNAAARRTGVQSTSTFGNKASLWVWRRSFGTCCGRFKPVVDIMLDSLGVSSDLVLAGYVCDPVQIAGQYLWMKSATTEEEEKDAIVDLSVTVGKMKNTSDQIWQTPGVGWIRVEGNFSKGFFSSLDTFLWYRPWRTRTAEASMINPLRGAVALPEEVRMPKLIAAVRLALRHHLPVQDVKRLANLLMESGKAEATGATTSNIRSERMMDYSTLFHQYDSRGKLAAAKWAKLLTDVGVRMKPTDVTQVFNFIDISHNGFVTLDEYTRFLSLTDYELDLAVEKLRVKLLTPCLPKEATTAKASPAFAKTALGVIGALSLTNNPSMGKQKIRESRALSAVFRMVNVKTDNILSLDEVMDLAARIEIFVTEEEARKILLMMDVNGDDCVDETDFIIMMKRESNCVVKKAFRIRETAAVLRRSLVRGTSEKVENNASATASKEQWKAFKKRYEMSTGQRFPGYISAHTLQVSVAALGVYLSAIEARELSLVVAPEKNGRVHLTELHSFMGRNCRNFGELTSLLERELLTDLIQAYRACHRAKQATGKEDVDLTLLYRKKLDDLKKIVENVYSLPPIGATAADGEQVADPHRVLEDDEDEDEQPRPQAIQTTPDPRVKQTSHEVISIAQLKAGLQYAVADKKIPESTFPNLEEWACLAILVDADVAEGDVYGVRLRAFLEGVAKYVVTVGDENRIKSGESVSLDLVTRDLKRQIYFEARSHTKSKKADYRAIFDLFDENHNGTLSTDELRTMLKRLQLINALPDHQVPQLLALIDKNKRGKVTFEDFAAFAEEGKALSNRDDDDDDRFDNRHTGTLDDLDEDDLDDGDIVTAVPPVVVTKNADCDWLAWCLYRAACHLDPLDPESVITELEARCAETEMTTNKSYITVKDFWNILFEVGLQSSMTKAQFTKGVTFVCAVGHGHDEDRVDYQALCRFAVRMGRAFRTQQQEKGAEVEKSFAPMLAELKKYFKELCAEHTAKAKPGEMPRYEKIFRRIDADGDGMLSPKEFRVALQRLQYKDAKLWSTRMVQRLFDECDRNRDGSLSIKEFTNYMLDREPESATARIAKGGQMQLIEDKDRSGMRNSRSGKLSADKLNLSDDEDDEVFSKQRRLTDHELMRKVNDLLVDIVPIESGNMVKHWEVVRAAVRRFFQRADPDHKGVVSEERFRAFLRRSGLQDSLTASELRRLSEKLKRRGPVGAEAILDYEKFCQMMTLVTESIPKSKADIVFSRFQDAAVSSATAGRSFMNLCSLVDLRLTGKISKDELVHIAKMMACHLTAYDVEAMLELLPAGSVGADQLIDYRMLQSFLQSYQLRDPSLCEIEPTAALNASWAGGRGLLNNSMSGALPAYATPGTNLYMSLQGDQLLSRSLTTPLGYSVSTPFPDHQTLGASPSKQSGAYDRILRQLVNRIVRALDQRERQRGSLSLRHRFEQMDSLNTGLVSVRGLQSALDDIGVGLNPSELQTVHGLYGRPNEDSVYYDSFCRLIESAGAAPENQQQPSYITDRTLMRLRDLRAEGRSPRDMFEAYDLDRLGLVTTSKFKDIVIKLDLLQTEHQLVRAIEDFSSIGNRSFVNYQEFCDRLERSMPLGSGTMGDGLRSSHRMGIADGDGYDGLRASSPLRASHSHSHHRDSARDNLQRFRMSNSMHFPIELDEGSDSAPPSYRELYHRDHALSSPKPSDSLSMSRRLGSPHRASRNSWDNTSSSLQAARTSPSKVGSRMWGSQTPLARKGEVLHVAGNKWCCPVCLYVENPFSAEFCMVCDSPNYSVSKVSSLPVFVA